MSRRPHRSSRRTRRRGRVLVASVTLATLAASPVASASQGKVDPPKKNRHAHHRAVKRHRAKEVTPGERRHDLRAARRHEDGVGRRIGLGDQQQLEVRDVVTEADGTTHTRYDRSYAGLRVIGGDLVVHANSNGRVRGVDRAHHGSVAVGSREPSVSKKEALRKARRRAGFSVDSGNAELVVFAGGAEPRLAWDSVVNGVKADQTPSRTHYVVDAHHGNVLSSWDEVETGRGESIYSGTVTVGTTRTGNGYEMRDNTRGGNHTIDMFNQQSGGSILTDADDVWGDGTNDDRASAGVDAQYGAAMTWDYYLDRHDRTGIFDDGQGVPSRVHYGNGYSNAFWDGSQMTYGDGADNANPLTEIDVAAHEMSHGVTEATAGLAYTGDAGGLNESTSDIFGTSVEFYADNPDDVGDYLIGEKLDLNGTGTPLRYMDRPSRDGGSYDCWSSTVGDADPHYSSGPGNHFFYLASEGSGAKAINGVSYNSPTCDGSSVAGIGRDAVEQIWYRALTVYMTSTETYPQARDATVEAATDLYGAGSAECAGIESAWDGVDVPVGSVTCSGTGGGGGGDGDCGSLPESYGGSLAHSDDYDYQPGSQGYYHSAAGAQVGCLRGPAGADFDLYLQKYNGSSWVTVAASESPGPEESISYNGSAGSYSWVVQSYSGSGSYTFGLDRP